jgi:hypothetical protein
MALPTALQLAVVVALFAVAALFASALDLDRRLRALPLWLRALVVATAATPLFFLDRDVFPDVLVDDSVVALAVFLALWIALPVLLSRVVATEPPESGSAC